MLAGFAVRGDEIAHREDRPDSYVHASFYGYLRWEQWLAPICCS